MQQENIRVETASIQIADKVTMVENTNIEITGYSDKDPSCRYEKCW